MSQRITLALAWTAILLTLVLIPGRCLNAVENPLTSSLLGLDKFIHCGIFILFSVFWLRTGSLQRRWLPVLVAGFALAIITEWAQGLPVIKRDPDTWDALADIIGVFVGLACFHWVLSPRMKPKSVSVDA